MKIKIISAQSYMPEVYPETNGRPWYVQKIPKRKKKQMLSFLKRNAAAGLLKYEILEA